MAKALLGHVGFGADAHLVSELRRLRRRVQDLELEVARLRAAHESLARRASDEELLQLSVPDTYDDQVAGREPALT